MPPLENVFSWSKSRDEQFRECQRKYYYDKYLSWGGWDPKAPQAVRSAYIFKNLKNRWAWKGESVHHVIEEVLKSLRTGRPVPYEAAEERLTETMRQNYRSSKAKRYLEDPKRNLGLFEHEYEKPVSDETWKSVHATSVECLRNFYGSELYQELLGDDKSAWLVIEDLEEYDLDGSKIYVKLDFARRKNGLIEIYDWKTGKEDASAASVQMGAYAMYAMRKWGVGAEAIRGYLFNLSAPKPVPSLQPISEALVGETHAFIGQSVAGMKALLSDPSRNIPKAASEFRYTDNPRLCGYCAFYKICEKYA